MLNKITSKIQADAICTAILLGYSASNNRTFEYEKDKDKIEHENVQKKFKKLNVEITVSKSGNASKHPIIIAKNNRFTPEQIEGKNALIDAGITLNSLQSGINANNTYGAYIGGYEDVSKTILIGPSALEQYKPVYRQKDDIEISKAYEKAKNASNAAIKALKDTNAIILRRKNIRLDLIDEIKEDFINGSLFKSYHGMVQAMIKYATTSDNNSLIFEIAYGPNTNKVSSCFPCCTFMTSNNTPPTSTHLGRGDNWNIPNNCSSTMRNNWEENISDWFLKGKKILTKSNIDLLKEINNYIPELFLEALTYESSFISKINNVI